MSERWTSRTTDQRSEIRDNNRLAAARYRTESPDRRDAASRRYRDRNRAIIREAKQKPCADCARSYPYYVMQFDHTGSEKNFNIGNIGPTGSRTRLLAEIALCDVVCANCHAERSFKRKFAEQV